MTRFTIILTIILALTGCDLLSRDAFPISGTITDLRGQRITGVSIVSESHGRVATSDENGYWQFDRVSGRTRVTPIRPGSVFIPPSRTVSGSTRNVNFQIATPILGNAVATREEAREWLRSRLNFAELYFPEHYYLDLVDHYYDIAPIYGIRADVALAQATHETGYFRYGNLVQPWQHNFAGIGATGRVSDGNTPLHGADPALVRFQAGVHGAIFSTPAVGVEAQIQHLYAYATTRPLPPGRPLLSPRFNLVSPRGTAPYVEYLGAGQNPYGRGWAPSATYGFTIVNNHLERMLATSAARR